MATKPKPRNLPTHLETSNYRAGKDNMVLDLMNPAEKPHLRTKAGYVVKINHAAADDETNRQMLERSSDPREAAWRGIEYKKNKYDLLKHFLGDHIPETGFALTTVTERGRPRYAEVMFQQQVPERKLSSLTAEQRADPRLRDNLKDLLGRMQYMYGVLGEVNARTAGHINLDAKLDLGGLSDTVHAEQIDHAFSDEEVSAVIDTNDSPNLLVDPDSMQLYCVDFDQGQWVPGMDQAKELAFAIDTRIQGRRDILQQQAGAVAINGAAGPVAS
jgi:hypothetical protein